MNNCTKLTENLQTISNEYKIVDSAIAREIPIKDGVSAKERIDQIIMIECSFEVGTNFRLAEKILGQDFLGPEKIKEVFDIKLKPEEIPPIPFTIEQINKAKKLGMFLVLRINKDKNGKPITLNNFPSKVGIIDAGDKHFYNDSPFFKSESLMLEWSLTTKRIVPETLKKAYVDQIQITMDYVSKYFSEIHSTNSMTKGKIPRAIDLVYDFYLFNRINGGGTSAEIITSSKSLNGFALTIYNFPENSYPSFNLNVLREENLDNAGTCISLTKTN